MVYLLWHFTNKCIMLNVYLHSQRALPPIRLLYSRFLTFPLRRILETQNGVLNPGRFYVPGGLVEHKYNACLFEFVL